MRSENELIEIAKKVTSLLAENEVTLSEREYVFGLIDQYAVIAIKEEPTY